MQDFFHQQYEHVHLSFLLDKVHTNKNDNEVILQKQQRRKPNLQVFISCGFWQVLHVGNTLWSTARTEGASWLDEPKNAKSTGKTPKSHPVCMRVKRGPLLAAKPQHNLNVLELIELFFLPGDIKIFRIWDFVQDDLDEGSWKDM